VITKLSLEIYNEDHINEELPGGLPEHTLIPEDFHSMVDK